MRRACWTSRRELPPCSIEGIASAVDDRPVEFSRTFVRGDRTRYYVERTVYRPDRMGAERAAPGSGGARAMAAPVNRSVTASEEEPTHA